MSYQMQEMPVGADTATPKR